jgi:hypothetical protein
VQVSYKPLTIQNNPLLAMQSLKDVLIDSGRSTRCTNPGEKENEFQMIQEMQLNG